MGLTLKCTATKYSAYSGITAPVRERTKYTPLRFIVKTADFAKTGSGQNTPRLGRVSWKRRKVEPDRHADGAVRGDGGLDRGLGP